MVQAPVTISKSSGVRRGRLIRGVTVMTNGGPQSIDLGKLHGGGKSVQLDQVSLTCCACSADVARERKHLLELTEYLE